MTRFQNAPGRPYKAIVTEIWPQLGDEDTRQYAWDVAYREVSTETMAYRASRGVPLDFFEPGAADPLRKSSVRPLLRVTCSARMHHPSPAPVLAEVWQTSQGPLFVASLPGGPGKVGNPPEGTSDRPAAARNDARRQRRSTGRADWTHIPITVVRVLLTDDVPVGLWVKCPDHEPAQLIRAQLSMQYERHRAAARADTLEPLYLRLDSVAALSSD